MALDVKAMIDKVVTALKTDSNLLETFKKDPVKAIESVLGIDLPDTTLIDVLSKLKQNNTATNAAKTDEEKKVAEAINGLDIDSLMKKAKGADADALKNAASSLLGGLFGKK